MRTPNGNNCRVIYKSPLPEVAIPDVPIHELILRRARELGSRVAVVDALSGRSLTYDQLAAGVRGVAAGLARRGLRKGDRFAIWAFNCPEYPVAFHGVCAAGGVNTTINLLYTPGEAHHQLMDSGARWLLTVPQLLDSAKEAAAGTAVEEIFVLGEGAGATAFGELMASQGEAPPTTFDAAQDLAALPYSSGTTGLAKGVMLTHRNLVANLVQTEVVQTTGEDDRVIGVLPFFHIYGMQVIMNLTLHRGGQVVTMPRFDLEQFLRALQDHRITRVYVAPPIVLALAKHPDVSRHDLSSVRVVFSGAAPLDAELARACSERLACRVSQGYGLTETSPVTHSQPEGMDLPYDSVGVCLPLTETRVVDIATGQDLGPGRDGEIWIRGPQVMKGYLNNPEATAATLDEEGWLHTGDIGRAGERGEFYVVDRVKELIKYKGYQVPPAELEAVLLSHPAVADAAVIPSPDPEAGEVPKAFVVKRSDVSADELIAFVAERVAPHKKVRRLEFIEQVPKSASGKILRRVLKERERQAAG